MKPITSNGFNDLVQLDFEQLALTRAKEEIRYLLDVIDHTTKWMEAIPLKEMTAAATAKAFFKNWICVYEPPKQVQTDQCSQFESRVFQCLCVRMQIQKNRSSTYYPKCHGLVERQNRTLII